MKYLFLFLLVGLMASCGEDASGDATGDAKRDTTGDATRDATGDAKNEIAKQPNCKDIDGFQTADISLIPNDYTGVAFKCVDGKVIWLYNYKDGKLEGLCRHWHENGQLKYEYNFKDGKRDGLCRTWYEDGQLGWEDNYKDGKLEGLCRYWHENGQLKWEDNYKDGNRISAKCFDEDGNLIKCDQKQQTNY